LRKKLIFDEEGKPHEMYEMEDADAWINDKGGIRGVEEEGRRFAEGQGAVEDDEELALRLLRQRR
jgi:ATP-dependent RNA helicase DDX10/DBP4